MNDIATRYNLPQWSWMSQCFEAWKHLASNDVADALRAIRDGREKLLQGNIIWIQPMLSVMAAEILLHENRAPDALDQVEDGLMLAARYGMPWFSAELTRLRSEARVLI
jgi:hypothetical protein